MQGSLDKDHLRGARCLVGPIGPPPRPRRTCVSTQTIKATGPAKAARARHLLDLSTRWGTDTVPTGKIAQQLEVHRSMRRQFRVNSFSGTTLSLELCGKFLIDLPPPVNIAYPRHIMSRDCDIPVLSRCLTLKEPRVVDATG